MKAGDFILYGGLAEQRIRKTWIQKIGRGTIIGLVAIFVFRAVIEVLVQNFLHKI